MLKRCLEKVRKIKVKSELEEEWGKRERVVWRGRKLCVVNKEGESWDFSSSWPLGQEADYFDTLCGT